MNDERMPWDDNRFDIGGEGRSSQRVATRNSRGNGKNVTSPWGG